MPVSWQSRQNRYTLGTFMKSSFSITWSWDISIQSLPRVWYSLLYNYMTVYCKGIKGINVLFRQWPPSASPHTHTYNHTWPSSEWWCHPASKPRLSFNNFDLSRPLYILLLSWWPANLAWKTTPPPPKKKQADWNISVDILKTKVSLIVHITVCHQEVSGSGLLGNTCASFQSESPWAH